MFKLRKRQWTEKLVSIIWLRVWQILWLLGIEKKFFFPLFSVCTILLKFKSQEQSHNKETPNSESRQKTLEGGLPSPEIRRGMVYKCIYTFLAGTQFCAVYYRSLDSCNGRTVVVFKVFEKLQNSRLRFFAATIQSFDLGKWHYSSDCLEKNR